jgi:hypothetical protein
MKVSPTNMRGESPAFASLTQTDERLARFDPDTEAAWKVATRRPAPGHGS